MLDDPRAAHDATWRGDFAEAKRLSPALARSADAVDRAWAFALDGASWHAGAGGRLPAASALEAVVAAAPAARLGASLACVHAAHASFLALDSPALDGWIALGGRLAAGLSDPEPGLWLDALGGFADLWADRLPSALERARAVGAGAGRAKLAPLVIEAASLGALAALAIGDVAEATTLARRASRMARTEAFPWLEYLANLALARVRRHAGRPHMAIHILRALSKVLPPPWHEQVAWETRCSAGPGEPVELAGVGPASRELGALLEAAHRGVRPAFDAAAAACRKRVRAVAPLAAEVEALVAAIDPRVELERAPAALRPWLSGADTSIPAGLQGLACPSSIGDEGGPGPAAFVVVRPGGGARRLLGLGAALAGGTFDPSRRPGRSEAAISALALAAAPGLTRAELFAAVYGFPYVPVRHQGVFDVMLHRVRTELSSRAALERQGERLTLVAPQGLVVPDPRCAGPEDDQLLRVLASRGGGTAKGAAEALGIPLRTAQAALQALVQEGVCIAERRGRLVEYRVEDTTFSEPTQR